MGKHDAVDRLMSLANEKVTPSREPATPSARAAETDGEAGAATDAEAVLEARVVATERGAQGVQAPTMHRTTAESAAPGALSAAATPVALARPQVPMGDRGRQLLSALRPFLPVVGGALRMVDHGAVQAVARLLPLLGGAAASPAADAGAEKTPLAELLTGFDERQSGMAEELKNAKQRIETHEEQLRRVRETVERTVVEQGSLAHLIHQLTDRSRLLTAAVIILLMLVVAQMVLLAIFLHR